MRTIGIGALWVAIVGQSAWIIQVIHRQGKYETLLYPLGVTLGFAALAVTGGRYRWIAAMLRIFVGIAFLSAIGDRLGIFGGPGTPGASWGSFRNFIIYTGQVNSFLPLTVIPTLAVIETVIEGLLGFGMLLGLGLRVAVLGSTVLLFLFGLAMTISLGLPSTFPFAVFVLATGTFLMTNVDSSFLSIDRLVRKRLRQASIASPNAEGHTSISERPSTTHS